MVYRSGSCTQCSSSSIAVHLLIPHALLPYLRYLPDLTLPILGTLHLTVGRLHLHFFESLLLNSFVLISSLQSFSNNNGPPSASSGFFPLQCAPPTYHVRIINSTTLPSPNTIRRRGLTVSVLLPPILVASIQSPLLHAPTPPPLTTSPLST